MEFPSAEMKRLIRGIGGAARAGEKDEQLRARAIRRMNMGLAGDRQIGERRGKSYWHGETEDIPSDHMDRARELAFVQPIQEAEDAIEHAIVHVEEVLAGLRSRLAGSGSAPRRVGTGHPLRRAGDRALREGGDRPLSSGFSLAVRGR
jgi:hypothetical protein